MAKSRYTREQMAAVRAMAAEVLATALRLCEALELRDPGDPFATEQIAAAYHGLRETVKAYGGDKDRDEWTEAFALGPRPEDWMDQHLNDGEKFLDPFDPGRLVEHLEYMDHHVGQFLLEYDR